MARGGRSFRVASQRRTPCYEYCQYSPTTRGEDSSRNVRVRIAVYSHAAYIDDNYCQVLVLRVDKPKNAVYGDYVPTIRVRSTFPYFNRVLRSTER